MTRIIAPFSDIEPLPNIIYIVNDYAFTTIQEANKWVENRKKEDKIREEEMLIEVIKQHLLSNKIWVEEYNEKDFEYILEDMTYTREEALLIYHVTGKYYWEWVEPEPEYEIKEIPLVK